MSTAARYSEMAFVVPAGVVVGYFIGTWLDGRFDAHWMYVAGVILGAAGGLFHVVRLLTQTPKDDA